jgi:mRNA interferase YafQ
MRTISRSGAFRRDYKRVLADPRHQDISAALTLTLDLLANDRRLPDRQRDHALKGKWLGFRECHVKPDLLLVYEKIGSTDLNLLRLSTHSQLFGK